LHPGAIERELIPAGIAVEQLYSFTAAVARREPNMARPLNFGRLRKNLRSFRRTRIFQLSQQYGWHGGLRQHS